MSDLRREMEVYAGEHDGHFPDRISALSPEFVSDPQRFICPEASERYKRELGRPHPFSEAPTAEEIDALSSYAVVPGLTMRDDPKTLLAYEKQDNHRNVRRVRITVGGGGIWDSALQQ